MVKSMHYIEKLKFHEKLHGSITTIDVIFLGLMVFFAGYYLSANGAGHHRVYYVFVLLPMFFLKWRELYRPLLESPLIKMSFVFIAYMVATRLWAIGDSHKPIYKSFTYGAYIICFLTAIYLVVSDARNVMENRIKLLLIALGFVSAVISLYVYFDSVFISESRGSFYRLRNVLSGYDFNPSPSGRYFGFAALLSLLYGFERKEGLLKMVALASFFVCMLALFFTHGRGPMLGFGVAIALLISLFDKKSAIYLLLLVTMVVAVYILVNPGFFSQLIERGSSHRIDIYNGVFSKVMEAPIFGRGLTASTYKLGNEFGNHCHSIYLAIALYGGLIGLTLWGLVLAFSYKLSWQVYRTSGDVSFLVMITYGVVCYLFDGDGVIDHPKGQWLLIWFPIACVAAKWNRLANKNDLQVDIAT